MVLPVFVVVVAFFALLISYPWEVLTVGTLCFLVSLPFSWMAYQEYARKDAEAAAAAHAAPASLSTSADEQPAVSPPSENSERPARLN